MAWHRNSPPMLFSPFPSKLAEMQLLILTFCVFPTQPNKKIYQSNNYTKRTNPLGFHLLYNHFRNMNPQIQWAFNFCLLWFQKQLVAFLLSISSLWFLRSASLHFSYLPLLILRRSQSKRNVTVQRRTHSLFSICNAKLGFVRFRNLAQ